MRPFVRPEAAAGRPNRAMLHFTTTRLKVCT